MYKTIFQRNLIAIEDLLLGTGQVNQTRGKSVVPVSKINAANFPYDDNFSVKEKIDSLDTSTYVDADNLPVYILTPHSSSALNLNDVIWIKDISSTERHVYYYDKIMFKYNPTDGGLIIDSSYFDGAIATITEDFTDADTVVYDSLVVLINNAIAAFQAADIATRVAFAQADTALLAGLNLGTAATKDVGTSAGNVVQILAGNKLPALDGSNLTGLPTATIPAGSVVQRIVIPNGDTGTINGVLNMNGNVPAITEGTQIFSTTITPKATGNKILVTFSSPLSLNNSNAYSTVPGATLFINGSFATGAFAPTANFQVNGFPTGPKVVTKGSFFLQYEYTAPNTNPIAIAVRVGTPLGDSIRLNDSTFGAGGLRANLVLEEVKV